MAVHMQNEEPLEDAAASGIDPKTRHRPTDGGNHLSRRQAIGRMSALATAGAAAWVVPEILIAKPAAGATLSGPAMLTGGSTPPAVQTATATATPTPTPTNQPSTAPVANPTAGPATSLAYTGLNIQRDAEIGAALIAGGWALHHWASRTTQAESPGKPA
jgi:hypothetical protein